MEMKMVERKVDWEQEEQREDSGAQRKIFSEGVLKCQFGWAMGAIVKIS